MCMTLPGQVRQLGDGTALVNFSGQEAWCNALAQPDVAVGDWVLAHAGLIISVVSAEEAALTLQAARSLEDLLDAADAAQASATGYGGRATGDAPRMEGEDE